MSKEQLRVLIVDDDKDDYILTKKLLSRIDGTNYSLDWVDNYDSASEKMISNQHDICFIDYQLGNYNGLDLIRNTIKKGCNAPMILLTGHGGHEVDMEAMQAGASDYLVKGSIGADTLERSIRYSIGRSQRLELLKKERDFSSAIIDTVGSLVIVLDSQGSIVRFNHACEQATQYSFEEVKGKHIWDLFIFPEEVEQAKKTFQYLLEGGQPAISELHWRTKSGSSRLISWTGTSLRDKNGNVEYVIGTGTDITEQRLAQKALRKEEARLKRLVQSNIIGIFFWDLSGKIIAANDAFCSLLGYSQEDILQSDLSLNTLTPIEHRYLDNKQVQGLANFNSCTPYEKELVKKDGSRISVLIGETDFDETQTNGVGFLLDLTERKKAQNALLESEARYRNIVETSAEGIWIITDENKIAFVNSQMAQMLGYTIEEMLGKSLHDFKGIDRKLFTEFSLEHDYKGVNEQQDFKFIHKDGSEVWAIINTNPLFDNQGKYNGLLVMASDITRRKQAEQKIQEQATLLEITSDAIFVCNQEHQVIFWNKAAQLIYGWTTEEIIGKEVYQFLFTQQSKNQYLEANNIALEQGQWKGELKQLTKSGQEIIVESRLTRVSDEQKGSKSILIVNTDITEKKKLEAQFLRAQRMECVGALASGVAHDLNNVLAPIMMFIQLLKTKLPDEKNQKLIAMLESSSQRGADLVKQVLSFGRGLESQKISIQISHLIAEVKKIVQETFPRNIRPVISIQRDLWTVLADTTQIHQVLMNLCVNARDAMPNGGTLSILAENVFIDQNYVMANVDAKIGHYVVTKVSDTGEGMSKETMDRIFEPFFTTKEIGKGTGLGLATVMSIVKSHNGFLTLESELGKGTTFKIHLPATDVKESVETKTSPYAELVGKGELILVVDDEISIREITKASLEAANYEVLTASDGTEAVTFYLQNKERISLVITDSIMPFMDGLATIRALRKINPDTKVIVASGITSNNMLDDGNYNANAVLAKPYTTEQLLKTVKDVIKNEAK